MGGRSKACGEGGGRRWIQRGWEWAAGSGLGLKELRDPLPVRGYVGWPPWTVGKAARCLQRRLGRSWQRGGWACSCWRLCLVSVLRRVFLGAVSPVGKRRPRSWNPGKPRVRVPLRLRSSCRDCPGSVEMMTQWEVPGAEGAAGAGVNRPCVPAVSASIAYGAVCKQGLQYNSTGKDATSSGERP